MGFINNILETNNEINLYLRTSKHPKFYVNYMVNKNRNKLKKTVNKIEDSFIPAEDIIEFVEILRRSGSNSYDCIKLAPNSDTFIVEAVIADRYKTIAIITYSNNIITSKRNIINTSLNGKIDYTENNLKKLEYREHDIENRTFNELIIEWNNNVILESIIGAIKKYLYDSIERSERINL